MALTESDVEDIYLDEVEEFFDKSPSVQTHRDPASSAINIKIRGEIDGELFGLDRTYTDEFLVSDSQSTAVDILVSDARDGKQSIKEHFTYRIDSSDTAFQFDELEDEVTCMRCGATVSEDRFDGELNGVTEVKYRMAMMAAVRGECDSLCPNARHTGMYR